MGRLSINALFTVLAISINTVLAGLWKKKVPDETLPMIRSSKRKVLTMCGSANEPMSRCKQFTPIDSAHSLSTRFFRVMGPATGN